MAGDVLDLPEYAEFGSGQLIYDDSAPAVTDESGRSGPVYRHFGAIQSFRISFANLPGFEIGAIKALEGLKSGRQIAVQDFDSFDGVYFQPVDFDYGDVFDITVWLDLPDATRPGHSQLTPQFPDANLWTGSQLAFSTASELGVLTDVFNTITITLEQIEEEMTSPVPLPASLPLALTPVAALGFVRCRRRC